MSSLSSHEKHIIEALFEMEGGFVLDFSNSSFAQFIGDVCNIDMYNGKGYEEYASKAKKLRQLWANENDTVVGNLINALLDRYIDNKQQIDAYGPKEQRRVEDIREVARRLLRHPIELTIPTEKEDTLRTLQEDINNALSRNQPTLVLDRLHTFSTRYLRNVCSSYDIGVTNDKGNYLPLHSLAGALKKHYLKNVVFDSPFVPLAIQNSIVIFEKFNEIRNKQSYAHDNDVLGNTEAEYVVRTMINTLSFIDSIERLAKRNSHSPAQEDPGISEVDYPFRYRGQNET